MSMGNETGYPRTDAKNVQAAAAGCCAVLIASLLAGAVAVEGAKRAWATLRPVAPYSLCETCGEILDTDSGNKGRRSCVTGGLDYSGHVLSGERSPAGVRGEVVTPHLVAGGHSSPATAPAGQCPDGADLLGSSLVR